MAYLEGNQSLFEANMDDILEDVRFLFEDTTAELDTDFNVLDDLASIDIQDKICKMADIEANMDNILEDVRFLFEDTTAEQDTDLHVSEDSASTDIYTKILKMTDETLEADVDKYLEDIRFLFDGEDTTAELDTSSLEENEIGAGNTEGVKQETFRQKVKRLKKGVRRFFSRFFGGRETQLLLLRLRGDGVGVQDPLHTDLSHKQLGYEVVSHILGRHVSCTTNHMLPVSSEDYVVSVCSVFALTDAQPTRSDQEQ